MVCEELDQLEWDFIQARAGSLEMDSLGWTDREFSCLDAILDHKREGHQGARCPRGLNPQPRDRFWQGAAAIFWRGPIRVRKYCRLSKLRCGLLLRFHEQAFASDCDNGPTAQRSGTNSVRSSPLSLCCPIFNIG